MFNVYDKLRLPRPSHAVQDLQPPSVGGAPSKASSTVVNQVVEMRGRRFAFEPQLSHNPVARRFFTAASRNSTLPEKTYLEGPDYDFREVDKVLGVEGLASRAFHNLTSATLNGRRGFGYWFESHDPKAKEIVERRLDELTYAVEGETTLDSLMRKVVLGMCHKSNVIIWVRRKARDAKKYKLRGQWHNEMQAIEFVDVTQIDVARNSETQAVTGFRLKTMSYDDIIPWSDCFLLRLEDGRADNLFAQPLITPVLDDILTLRRLEEIHELAMGKATFPLIHVGVGDPKNMPKIFGVTNLDTEVTRARAALEGQAPEGFLVTPGWYKLEIIEPKSVSDFLPYFQWYRERVIIGLDMDTSSMGLGDAGRQSASAMSLQLMMKVRNMRNAIATEFNRTIIHEILTEAGLDPVGPSAVFMRWEDPDLESQLMWENEAVALYQASLITRTEARGRIGYDPLTDEQKAEIFMYENGEIQSEVAKAKASVASQGSTNPTTAKPKNQHGTSPAKPSRATRKDVYVESVFRTAMIQTVGNSNLSGPVARAAGRLIALALCRYVKGEDQAAMRQKVATIMDALSIQAAGAPDLQVRAAYQEAWPSIQEIIDGTTEEPDAA